jgi:hypothetical protein
MSGMYLRRTIRYRRTHDLLPHKAPGNTHSDAQDTPDGLRSHTIYDGSSGSEQVAPPAVASGLLSNGIGSKV